MGIACLLFFSHMLYFLPLPGLYHYADPFYHLLSLLVYPIYYVYIRLLTVDRVFDWKKHGVYFLPALLLFLLYLAGVLLMTKDEHLDYLYRLLLSGEKLRGIFLYQKSVYLTCRVVFIIQGLVYIWLSIRLVAANKKNVQNYYANTSADNLDKIYWLNISLFVTIVFGIILSLIGKENFVSDEKSLILPSVIFSVTLFVIGWLGNIQRAVLTESGDQFQDPVIERIEEEYEPDRLEDIRKKIKLLFDEGKIFLNKDLTIWEVARVLGTNRTYVSSVINNDFKQNFSSFVNSYRVKHAKMLQGNNPDISKQDLAEMSGFGSQVSMKRAFDNLL
jgi:AraC-like DNA-binding protein